MLPRNLAPTVSVSSLTITAWWPMPFLLLPATLARHLGLRELVDHHLDLGSALGRVNTGDKLMTLVGISHGRRRLHRRR